MARTKAEKATQEEPLEKQLWKSADKLRKNIDGAEYKHVVLGLIFLKYISDSFEDEDFKFAERFAALKAAFKAQLLEEAGLNAAIAANLAKVKL